MITTFKPYFTVVAPVSISLATKNAKYRRQKSYGLKTPHLINRSFNLK